jgi:hypothetical protein
VIVAALVVACTKEIDVMTPAQTPGGRQFSDYEPNDAGAVKVIGDARLPSTLNSPRG